MFKNIIIVVYIFSACVFSKSANADISVLWEPNIVDSEAATLNRSDFLFEIDNKVFISTTGAHGDKQIALLTNNSDKLQPLSIKESLSTWIGAKFIKFKDKTLLLGGIDNGLVEANIKVLSWNESRQTIETAYLTNLPSKTKNFDAEVVGGYLYILFSQNNRIEFQRLQLTNSLLQETQPTWQHLPAPNNALGNISDISLTSQNNGKGAKLYSLVTHQTARGDEINKLWKYSPNTPSSAWDLVKNQLVNTEVTSIAAFGQSHILATTNSTDIYSLNAITESWAIYESAAVKELPQNIDFGNSIIAGSRIYQLRHDGNNHTQLLVGSLVQPEKHFGFSNMAVLVVYLLLMVTIGLFFVFKNKNTDDYFRGGQSIPWWAAACSIYATMLSSLTYVALPAVVYQTDWLLLVGIWMIIVVAPIAIYVAMPFFRQINATSAYEYLSKRFNMSVRLFASGLFTLFHVGRMGIVMALTALALSAVTPLTASESVLIMGVLCLIYCTLGGIEAVIWTDTIQTLVLLIGAFVCFITIILGLEGGFSEFVQVGISDNKFTLAQVDFSLDSITTLAIWVIVIGGIGQNISSYTADQAIVQRYMVTTDPEAAKKSIWANAVLAVPGALLFFCIGTGLYVFYQVQPEKLDPTIQIDQIFPMFIATELPVGIAGLIVAGIFSAAQSTVSTSMNSIATTLVTDFIRPFKLIKSEKGYMSAARWLTFLMGTLGTLAGLIFINPEIRSLMNAYFKVIGMFMGALGGLYVLGALTKRANAKGAIVGILCGVGAMISAWQFGWANGYLYATIGIVSCLFVGYFASLVFKSDNKDLDGLTLYTMRKDPQLHKAITRE
ncbi:MAG: sodium:solute symporter [Thalassotalea sp.]|nr:sodium:solute symporter [Thalassotalea sp.]